MGSKRDPERGLRACEDSREIDLGVVPSQSTNLTPPNGTDYWQPTKAGWTGTGVAAGNATTADRTSSPDLFGSCVNSLDSPGKDGVGLKLDLPEVCNLLKFAHFRGTTSKLVLYRTKRTPMTELMREIPSSGNGDTIKGQDNKRGKASRSKPTAEDAPKRKGKKQPERSNDTFVNANLFVGQAKGSNAKKPKVKDDAFSKFLRMFQWVRTHTILEEKKQRELAEEIMGPTSPKLFNEVADLLCISTDELSSFRIFHEHRLSSVLPALRNLVNHLVYPDLMKVMALCEWQNPKGSIRQCAYYLSESHGTHLRSDIVDKHCLFFCKKEEMGSKGTESNEGQERLRKKVFVRQIKDALTLGRKYDEFATSINEINPNWNVIQLSAMGFGNNRFASDIAKFKTTPPLFLSSFLQLPGESKRTSFVTYVKQPNASPEVLPHGILEEFKKVMIKNRHINEAYSGSKTSYWNIRAEHNTHLGAIMDSMQQHWIGPFSVLFPGNIKDERLRQAIMKQVDEMQGAAGRRLVPTEKLFLYKLTENLSMVHSEIKSGLYSIVATYLRISSGRAKRICEIINSGEIIDAAQERWPTILVLDSELEQLPWDWMPCLRTTSVTRMSSISAICSTLNIMKISRPRFPEIVDMSKCTYILNPDNSLNNVQKRLESFLKSYPSWSGVVARKPSFEEMENALQNHDAMIYCGHGSGINFFPEFALQRLLCKAAPILMGCSSAQSRYNGPKANSSSIVSSYLIAACPSVVGFLWEITDVECDRVTVDMIQRWLPGSKKIPTFAQFDPKKVRTKEKCLATAMLKSRKAATQFLTEAALVNYGLPIDTR